MAPNKFEKHIKKQLQEREIKPSANAWDRLSEKLDADAPPSKKRGYYWYGIAASFIGLLIISTVYFIENAGVEPEIKVVDTPTKEVEKILEQNGLEEELVNTAVVEEKKNEIVEEKFADPVLLKGPSEELANVEKSKAIEENDHINIADKSPTVMVDNSDAIAQSQNDMDGKFENQFEKAEQLIDTKVSELLATVNHFENSGQDITDSEVDSLLRQAKMELMAENLFQEPSTISATTLLTEVEDELDPTFRDRIFESLKKKLLKARTAVANRNN